MLTRIITLATALLLSACQFDSIIPGSGQGDNSTALQTEIVQFQRSGGPKCPATADASMDDMRCAILKVTYPRVLAAGNPAAADALNSFIRAQLLEYSDDSGKQPETLEELADMFINEYQQMPDNFGSWELERHLEVSFGNAQLATLNYAEYGYTGGAHPFSGQRYFIMDLQNGQQLTLNELLASDYAAPLNQAGEKAFREAREIPPGNSLEEAGFWFENNTFQLNTNAGALADGLAFVFNPYEVAPYALGPTEFTIPWQAIRDLVPADSPLAAVAR